jgi:hypothetical protein
MDDLHLKAEYYEFIIFVLEYTNGGMETTVHKTAKKGSDYGEAP